MHPRFNARVICVCDIFHGLKGRDFNCLELGYIKGFNCLEIGYVKILRFQ